MENQSGERVALTVDDGQLAAGLDAANAKFKEWGAGFAQNDTESRRRQRIAARGIISDRLRMLPVLLLLGGIDGITLHEPRRCFQHECIQCHCKIPPGRQGRKCEECRR